LLVERDREIEELRSAISKCSAGNGSVIVVSGPPGSGKTTLLRAAARLAEASGLSFLAANGSRLESDFGMGLIGQVLATADLTEAESARARRLLENASVNAMLQDSSADDPSSVHILHGVTALLREVAYRAPVLIGIDDAHFADALSMHCLHYLVRRIDRVPIVVIINQATGVRPPWPVLATELLNQPHSRHLRLKLFSPAGTAAFLDQHAHSGASDPHAWHQLSGGNPLLLRALVEDSQATVRDNDEPSVGEAYTQAVLACLQRGDEMTLAVARALALLNEPAPPALLGELLDVATPAALADSAEEAGLLYDGWFRHPRCGAAILGAMDPVERSDMHGRAARALYNRGASALTVARHQLAAHRVDASWSVTLLRDAADQAIDEGDNGLALELLRLAEQRRDDGAGGTAIQAALLRLTSRIDPVTAERYALGLSEPASLGQLTVASRVILADYFMRFGRPDRAMSVLSAAPAAMMPHEVALIRATASRLALLYPHADNGDSLRRRTGPGDGKPPPEMLRVRTADIFDAVRDEGLTEDVVDGLQAVLFQHRLDDHTCESVFVALQAMVYADQLDNASFWCESLLTEATNRGVATWCAMLAAIRGLIALRRGDLLGAERDTEDALTYVGVKGWGVYLGLPFSTMLILLTQQERHEEALRLIATPLPEAMFRTLYGPQYVRARGRFHLARGAHKAARADFEACGELMRRWGIDLPGMVPWRADLAEARRATGPQPGSLVGVQHLAEHHDLRTSLTRPSELGTTSGGVTGDDRIVLSDAERRVATLAARGATNQQIAHKLFITVSTVEQHLTRVYRKLGITSRAQLRFRRRDIA
jgi:DNA-binding CsgD family transcriptional regulator/energy-coupling factor transporter ATP-binding protein EcfA2